MHQLDGISDGLGRSVLLHLVATWTNQLRLGVLVFISEHYFYSH